MPSLIPCEPQEEFGPCGPQPTAPLCDPPEPEEVCPTICVCGVGYGTIEDAWKATNIPPHKLRFYAKTPSFIHIYYL